LDIAFHVPLEFRLPELDVALGRVRKPAPSMAMPEAAVNEYDCTMTRKHNIGLAGQIFPMKTETKTEPMQDRPDGTLRPRVASLNARHIPASALSGDSIHTYDTVPDVTKSCHTEAAIDLASNGGTAFPTWPYPVVRFPQKK
jgi:hypothetical protein